MKKHKFRFVDITFFLSYSIFLFIILYNNVSFFQPSFKYLNLIGCVLLLITFLLQNQKYKIKNILKILFVVSIALITFYSGLNSNRTDFYIIELFLLIIVSKNLEFKNMIKFDFTFKFFNIIIIIFLAKFDIIENLIFYRNGIMREALGFTHPNILGAILTSTAIDLMYIYYIEQKKGIFPIAFTLISLFIIYFIANSRASFCLLIFVFIHYMLKNKKIIMYIKYFKPIITTMFIICSLLSLYLTHLYAINNEFGIIADKILSGRLYFNNIYLKHHSLNLFGNILYFTGNEALMYYGRYNMILDNSYVYLLLRFGIVITIIFALLFYFLIKKSYESKNYFLIYIILGFLIYGMFERHTFIVFYNPFLLYFVDFIYEKKTMIGSDNKNEI